ncbi:hypothetical protein BDW72DRAFT_175753, partial [Aspergillus terricola var. indicus]
MSLSPLSPDLWINCSIFVPLIAVSLLLPYKPASPDIYTLNEQTHTRYFIQFRV